MKRTIALLLILIFALAALSACSINININKPTEADSTAASSEAATQAATESDEPTAAPIGTLSDYVKTGKEATVTYGDGNTNTLRIPELLLDSADAKAANEELQSKFGSALDNGSSYSGMYALDYEAYLNGSVLSVVTVGKYDGGNTYGLAYNFDVLTGKKLDNKQVCDMSGENYEEELADLREELEEYYEEKYGSMPGNDAEREKTFSDDNLKQAVMYLDNDGDFMALVDVYAAVGGGHWVVQLDL